MSLIFNKYSDKHRNLFNKPGKFKNIQFGIVVNNNLTNLNPKTVSDENRNERFNSDSHAIRVRIIGAKYDNPYKDDELPNCFPLLPKHINVVPKVGELVMVFLFGEDEVQSDRFYIGPFISREDKLDYDKFDTTATSNFEYGISSPGFNINSIPEARGIYEDKKHITIEGRDNTDIIQRDKEVIIRVGKHEIGNKLKFNSKNPGYIQLKFNHKFSERVLNEFGIGDGDVKENKNISVTNIVSDKINLLTYSGDKSYNLTSRDLNKRGGAEYITEEEMNKILNEAHPIPYGDILLQYLKLLKNAFINHVHNNHGHQPTDILPNNSVDEFIKKSGELEKLLLSKNIRVN